MEKRTLLRYLKKACIKERQARGGEERAMGREEVFAYILEVLYLFYRPAGDTLSMRTFHSERKTSI